MEQGGAAQVRFQPRIGQLLAAAAENVVSIFDVEADRRTHSLQVSVLNMKVKTKQENTFLCNNIFIALACIQGYLFDSQGHSTEVHSVCWDVNGEYLASVSQESVRVWSLTSGECIHELSSSGNKFHSCVFHPSYSTLLVIGGYQVIFSFLWCYGCNL